MTHEISKSDKRNEIRRRFLAVDSSNVMDALDMINRPNQGLHSDFSPYPADAGKVAGFAYTIRGQMTPYEGTGDAEPRRDRERHQPCSTR